jgi:hypothetical protein
MNNSTINFAATIMYDGAFQQDPALSIASVRGTPIIIVPFP